MHYIVESQSQLDRLKDCCTRDSCFVQVISSNDNFHPKFSKPSLIYYRCSNSKGYILPVNHTETFNLKWEDILNFLNLHEVIHVIDKKYHDYFLPSTLPVTDIQFKILNKTNKSINTEEYNTIVHTHFYRQHYGKELLNTIIPVSKHYEKWENIFTDIKEYLDRKIDNFFDVEMTGVFKSIEENGIKVSKDIFLKHFEPTHIPYSIRGGKTYSRYNLYNITTRPSNAFNSINFAALPKGNKSRQSFIPYNDYFIEYDFSAYHPSLICSLLNIKFSGSLYNVLSKILETTKEEAKEITFKNIYGGVKEQYRDKFFFKDVYEYTTKLWNEWNKTGQITLKTGRILHKSILEDMTRTKLFNYMVQSLETYENVKKIKKVTEYLEDKESSIILYTYDSITIDFNTDDGIEILKQIKHILEENGYDTKLSRGTDYSLDK